MKLPLRKRLLPPGTYWLWALVLAYLSMIVAMVGWRPAFWIGIGFGVYVMGACYFQWWTEHHAIRTYHERARQRSVVATDADRR
jgi:hypothetical protein